MSPDDRTEDIRSAVSRKAGSSNDLTPDVTRDADTTGAGATDAGTTTDAAEPDIRTADTSVLEISEPDTTPTETTMDTDRATHPAAPTTPTATSTTAVHDDVVVRAPQPDRGVRVGTVVWGLVIAAVGIGLIAYASGQRFDVDLAVIILIAAAGVALLGGSLLSNRRRPR